MLTIDILKANTPGLTEDQYTALSTLYSNDLEVEINKAIGTKTLLNV